MANTDIKLLFGSLRIAGGVLVSLWAIHLLCWAFDVDESVFGIRPRSLEHLWSIISGPFVHADFKHLIANSGPLFFFSAAIFYFYRPVAWRTFFWVLVMTNTWVWVAAHSGSHIGASGMVYGLGAFLFFSGVFRKDLRSMLLALSIAFFYGGMVWGVLPLEVGVSWESHLFGALSGVILAFFFRQKTPVDNKKYIWENEPETAPGDDEAIWNYKKNWVQADQLYTLDDPEDNQSRPDNP